MDIESDFIGDKFKLRIQFLEIGKGVHIKTFMLDDPEMEQRLRETYPKLRIFAPGWPPTDASDFDVERVNVYITSNGFIDRIVNG